jgi:hypothetical protein
MATVGKHPSGVRSRRCTKPEPYRQLAVNDLLGTTP